MPRTPRGALLAALLALAACGARPGEAPPPPPPAPTAAPAAASPAPTEAPAAASPAPTEAPAADGPTAVPTIVPTATAPAEPTTEPTAGPTAAPPGSAEERERLVIELVNRERAAAGLPPYQADAGLSAAARAHSCDMAATHEIGHVGSDGSTVAQRLPPADPPWQWPSESVAAGVDDPAAVVAMWMDEPPDGWHRRNILDPEQRAAGAGYCADEADPTGNRSYWTLVVARRDGM